jgi:hypothetical protein
LGLVRPLASLTFSHGREKGHKQQVETAAKAVAAAAQAFTEGTRNRARDCLFRKDFAINIVNRL